MPTTVLYPQIFTIKMAPTKVPLRFCPRQPSNQANKTPPKTVQHLLFGFLGRVILILFANAAADVPHDVTERFGSLVGCLVGRADLYWRKNVLRLDARGVGKTQTQHNSGIITHGIRGSLGFARSHVQTICIYGSATSFTTMLMMMMMMAVVQPLMLLLLLRLLLLLPFADDTLCAMQMSAALQLCC